MTRMWRINLNKPLVALRVRIVDKKTTLDSFAARQENQRHPRHLRSFPKFPYF